MSDRNDGLSEHHLHLQGNPPRLSASPTANYCAPFSANGYMWTSEEVPTLKSLYLEISLM